MNECLSRCLAQYLSQHPFCTEQDAYAEVGLCLGEPGHYETFDFSQAEKKYYVNTVLILPYSKTPLRKPANKRRLIMALTEDQADDACDDIINTWIKNFEDATLEQEQSLFSDVPLALLDVGMSVYEANAPSHLHQNYLQWPS